MVEKGLDFFFDMIKWVFTDFLIKVKILNISVLFGVRKPDSKK